MPGPDEIDDLDAEFQRLRAETRAPTRRTVLPEVEIIGTPEGTGSERMRRRGGRVEVGPEVDTSLPLAPDPETEARMRELAAPSPAAPIDPSRQRRIDLNEKLGRTSALGDVANIANPFISRAAGSEAAERTGERIRNLWDELTQGDATLGGRNPIAPIVGRDVRGEAPIAGLAETMTLGHPEEVGGRIGALRDPIIRGARAIAPALSAVPGSPIAEGLARGARTIGEQPLEGDRTYEERARALGERAATSRAQAPAATGLGELAGQAALTLAPGATTGRGIVAQGALMGAAGAHGASDTDFSEDPIGVGGRMLGGAVLGGGGAAALQGLSRGLGATGRGPARTTGDLALRDLDIATARAAQAAPRSTIGAELGEALGSKIGGGIGARALSSLGGGAERMIRGLGSRGRAVQLEALQTLARNYPDEAARILGNDTVRRLIEGASSVPATSQAVPDSDDLDAEFARMREQEGAR